MHEFETERLSMRAIDEQDKALYCSLYTDEIVMQNIGQALTQEKAEKCFATCLKMTNKPEPILYVWVIMDKNSGETLGIQNISRDKSEPQQAEFGIMLVPSSYRKHVAFESIGALTEYGLKHLNLAKMYSNFHPENKAILRIAQKLNYKIDMDNLIPNTGQASCFMLKGQHKYTFIQHKSNTPF